MKPFDVNIGLVDRAIRALVGIACLSLYLWGQISPQYSLIVAVVGVLLLLTSITQRCLLYNLLGISTAEKKAVKKEAKKTAKKRKRRKKR